MAMKTSTLKKRGKWKRTRKSDNKRFKSLKTRITEVFLVSIAGVTILFSIFIFQNMSDEVINENIRYQTFAQTETKERFTLNRASINMASRLFQSNETLVSVLNVASKGKHLNAEELIDFHDNTVTTLDTMVHNNPAMYAVRVYGANDNIEEMMSIIFKNSRLKSLTWGETGVSGWHFNYRDNVFGGSGGSSETRLVSRVDAVNVYDNGTIGFIESAMTMEQMFPELYEENTGNFGFFVDRTTKHVYYGTNAPENLTDISRIIMGNSVNYSKEHVYKINCGNETYIVYNIRESDMGINYFGLRNITDSIAHVRFLRNCYILASIAFFIIIGFIINAVITGMLNQLYEMVGTMKTVETGDLTVRNEIMANDETGELATKMNTMLDRINELMDENIKRERLVMQAGMKAMQNQINAHFIYNVLESIKMLAEINEEYVISDSITSLGTLLRYSISWKRSLVTVEEELNYIDNYIKLMNLRNDFEVTLSLNIPTELMKQTIPKMSLQPVIENSVLHGIAPLGEDASIYLKAYEENEDVFIEISDNGAGMSSEALAKLRDKINSPINTDDNKEGGHGVGLKNVQDRIAISFGKQYGMSVFSEEGKYTKVILHLPKQVTMEEIN